MTKTNRTRIELLKTESSHLKLVEQLQNRLNHGFRKGTS